MKDFAISDDPAVQRQPGRHDPLTLAGKRTQHAAHLDAIGGRRDDRPRSGQVPDQGVQLRTQPGP